MTFSALLTQRCTIERKTSSKNSYGHIINTWIEIAQDVPCRVDYMFVTSSFLSQTPNGQISGNDYIGFFNYGTDIKMGDRIIWQDLTLFARPVNPIFATTGSVHHLEIAFGLQET